MKTAIGYKIAKLLREGVPHKQAIATALSMSRAGRLGPRGGYLGFENENPIQIVISKPLLSRAGMLIVGLSLLSAYFIFNRR